MFEIYCISLLANILCDNLNELKLHKAPTWTPSDFIKSFKESS